MPQKTLAAGDLPRTPLGELTTLPQTPQSAGEGHSHSPYPDPSLNCRPTFWTPPTPMVQISFLLYYYYLNIIIPDTHTRTTVPILRPLFWDNPGWPVLPFSDECWSGVLQPDTLQRRMERGPLITVLVAHELRQINLNLTCIHFLRQLSAVDKM
jgi:hypothetical protein